MTSVLLPFLYLMLAGAAWRYISPRIAGAPPVQAQRATLITLVFYFFLPALAFRVLYLAPLESATWKVPLIAALSCIACVALGLLAYAPFSSMSQRSRGAMLLACGWSNATYLGFPIVTAIYGSALGLVPILFDQLALTPLLLTLGIAIANRFNSSAGSSKWSYKQIWQYPAPLAALLGLLLNALRVPLPESLLKLLETAGSAVAPLMIFGVGLLLRASTLRHSSRIVPALAIKLAVMPLIALLLVDGFDLSGAHGSATLLEAAMPTMVLTLAIAERYGLDAELLALEIAASTAIAFGTLPWAHSLIR